MKGVLYQEQKVLPLLCGSLGPRQTIYTVLTRHYPSLQPERGQKPFLRFPVLDGILALKSLRSLGSGF